MRLGLVLATPTRLVYTSKSLNRKVQSLATPSRSCLPATVSAGCQNVMSSLYTLFIMWTLHAHMHLLLLTTDTQRLHDELGSVVILMMIEASSKTREFSGKQSGSLCAHARLCIQLFGATGTNQPASSRI